MHLYNSILLLTLRETSSTAYLKLETKKGTRPVYLTTQGHAVYNFINTLLGKMNNCLVNKTSVTILYGNKFSFAMAEKGP